MTNAEHIPTSTGRSPRRRRLRAAILLPALALYAVLGLLAAAPASAADTGSVSGTVRTDAGIPIPNAYVSLREIGRSALTGADGTYAVTGVPLGTYTVDTTAPCRIPTVATVAIGGAETQDQQVPRALAFDTVGHACRPASFGFVPDHLILPVTGDEASTTVALPFAFPFYGSSKTSVTVSSDGYLTFGADATDPANGGLSGQGAPRDSIMVFWDDLVLDTSSGVVDGIAGTAPNRTYSVTWRGARFFGDPSGARVSFQVQLHENGDIGMTWAGIGDTAREKGNSATIGMTNAVPDGSSGQSQLVQSVNRLAVSEGLQVEYQSNRPPVANAGSDRSVASGTTSSLDGSGSTDPDGTTGLTFEWLQVAGPATTIQDPKKAKTSVSGLSGPATLTYQLRVTDPFGRSTFDAVTITVQAPAPK